jgi:hypothetical protein
MVGLVGASMALAACSDGGTVAPADASTDTASAPVAGDAAATPAADAMPAQAAGDAAMAGNLATTPETALAAMQGQWVGIEDPKSTLSVTGNQLVMGYEGDSSANETFRIDFVSECEGRPISGPRLGFTLTADDMVLCYTDLDADADNLEYFYAPRGNRQAFRRPGAAAAR